MSPSHSKKHGRVQWTAALFALLVALTASGIAAFISQPPQGPIENSAPVLRSKVSTAEVLAGERIGDLVHEPMAARLSGGPPKKNRPDRPPLPKNRRWHTWLNVLDANTSEPLSRVTLVAVGTPTVVVAGPSPSPIDVTAATRGRARSLPLRRPDSHDRNEDRWIGTEMRLPMRVLVDGYVAVETTVNINKGGEKTVELQKGAQLVVRVLGRLPNRCQFALYRGEDTDPLDKQEATPGETFAFHHLEPATYKAVLFGERAGTKDLRGRPLIEQFANTVIDLRVGDEKTIKLLADWKLAETNAAAE